MNMFMLADITSNVDLSGIFCLAAIPCLFIAVLAYYKGGFFGGCGSNFVFFLAFMLITTGLNRDGNGIPTDFISNRGKTKFIKRFDCRPKYESGCIYRVGASPIVIYGLDIPIPASINGLEVYIPEAELRKTNGIVEMISTGRPPTADDYYLYIAPYDRKNVSKEFGGDNEGKDDVIPKWLYHPAAPTFIFGTAGLPCLLLMSFFAGGKKK